MSKIEDYFNEGNNKLFLKELGQFTAFLIKRYVGELEASDFEELKDSLICRVFETFHERPFVAGRSDFRTYIYSIIRNGISSFNHRRGREIPSEEVRSNNVNEEGKDDKDLELKYNLDQVPAYNEIFTKVFPKESLENRYRVAQLIKDGEINEKIWDQMTVEQQNYARVLLWKMFAWSN